MSDALCSISKEPKVVVTYCRFSHDAGLSQPGKPPAGVVGLLDLHTPCSLPFCVLQVQFQITEVKLRPVLYLLSLQRSLGNTFLIQPLLFLTAFSNLWVNKQKSILFCCFLPNRQLLSQFMFQDWMKIKYYACWECMFTCNDNFKITLLHLWNEISASRHHTSSIWVKVQVTGCVIHSKPWDTHVSPMS